MPPKAKNGPQRTPSGAEVPVAPQRVRFALQLLDSGLRYNEVRRQVREKFKISKATAEKDIKRAYARIATEDEKERPQLAARISARLWRLAASAERAERYDAAVSALARLAKLHGLEAPKKHHVTGGVTEEQKQLLAALSLTPVERAKRIAELEQQVAAEGGGEVESKP